MPSEPAEAPPSATVSVHGLDQEWREGRAGPGLLDRQNKCSGGAGRKWQGETDGQKQRRANRDVRYRDDKLSRKEAELAGTATQLFKAGNQLWDAAAAVSGQGSCQARVKHFF